MVWRSADWRVVRVADADFPAFYRVIASHHVVERVLRERLRPAKINLAAFGNMVPHLHWHVIARFDWDSHFPQPVWGGRQREVVPPAVSRLACGVAELDAAVAQALGDG